MPLIHTEEELEEVLTQPRPELVTFIRQLASPLILLGAGGKMGPTLAVLARRAAAAANHPLEIIAVSRFSNSTARTWLEDRGVKTRAADLLDRAAVQALPDSANVIHLAGLKFGTVQNPSLTWAVNTLAPAHVAERYASARLVALSTGNVYPLVSVNSGGAAESHPLTPEGEYANAAVARERVCEYFSHKNKTPVALLRLTYAVELRYGVLADIAQKVWSGELVDISNGWLHCIWQGDANEMILRAFALATSPAQAWNLTSPQPLHVRTVAETFAQLLDKPARFTGVEGETALLNTSARLCAELGPPATSLDTVMRWIAHWTKTGGRSLGRPTHFEVRNGAY